MMKFYNCFSELRNVALYLNLKPLALFIFALKLLIELILLQPTIICKPQLCWALTLCLDLDY